jgi:wyosine [tRNA(Phe)-imidazoG37] synthetase (radical SAM superfamily)
VSKAYISTPIRPPAESFVNPPTERDLIEAYEKFKEVLGAERVELLNMPEPPPRMISGDPLHGF